MRSDHLQLCWRECETMRLRPINGKPQQADRVLAHINFEGLKSHIDRRDVMITKSHSID